ncbi:MAG: hypothetical protein NC336_08955, partial [Clostridium sp.]|nr:hypothetical protein [Clostridium sp.]
MNFLLIIANIWRILLIVAEAFGKPTAKLQKISQTGKNFGPEALTQPQSSLAQTPPRSPRGSPKNLKSPKNPKASGPAEEEQGGAGEDGGSGGGVDQAG